MHFAVTSLLIGQLLGKLSNCWAICGLCFYPILVKQKHRMTFNAQRFEQVSIPYRLNKNLGGLGGFGSLGCLGGLG